MLHFQILCQLVGQRPNREDFAVQELIDCIEHGDVIQIVHGLTYRAVNYPDVAAPDYLRSQEVSCYATLTTTSPYL